MNTILEYETGRVVPLRDDQAIPNHRATLKEADLRDEPHLNLRRILVPVDFTPASVHALRYAATLAERFGSTVCLLHVVEHGSFMNDVDNTLLSKSDEEMTQESTEQLTRLARQELGPHLPAKPVVRCGKAAREILHAAETLEADLIILAAHKRSALGRWVLGSTADQVVHQAACPVLVIQCADKPQLERTLWRDTEEDADAKPMASAMSGTP